MRTQKQQGSEEKAVPIRAETIDLPLSSFLEPDARRALVRREQMIERIRKACPYGKEDLLGIRKHWHEHYLEPLAVQLRDLYDVCIQPETVAGVYTENIVPTRGVIPKNRDRVLINLHGGGFLFGARSGGQIESIPVAALSGIKVVSVDYRMAPEFQFPAATEDVVAVYAEMLKSYCPENVGIFGCSAGAVLTAETVATLERRGLPRPGAIGMLFGAAAFWADGDTGAFRPLFAGAPLEGANEHPYFKNTEPNDPLAFPARSSETMAKFPPSLLVSSTRDHALSSVVHTHSCLVKQGVEAELHVWEGLGHVFSNNADLPQAIEVHEVTTRFFSKYLGVSRQ